MNKTYKVKFFLNTDFEPIPEIHFTSTINDYTLCGLTMDRDDKTAGDYEPTKEKVNCKYCIEIVEECKKIDKSQYNK